MGRNRLMSKHLLRAMLTLWFPFLGSFKQAVRQVMRLGKKFGLGHSQASKRMTGS